MTPDQHRLDAIPTPITRRRFAAGLGVGLALVVIGCGGSDEGAAHAHEGEDHGNGGKNSGKGDKKKIKLATEPFLIGPKQAFRDPGLYQQFHKDKGVWVISDGKELVVLSAMCTHLGCATAWKEDQAQFACPCHKSKFDLDGINQPGGKSKRPLERCSLRLVQIDDGEQVEVDPTRRLRRDKDEWSDPAASIALT